MPVPLAVSASVLRGKHLTTPLSFADSVPVDEPIDYGGKTIGFVFNVLRHYGRDLSTALFQSLGTLPTFPLAE